VILFHSPRSTALSKRLSLASIFRPGFEVRMRWDRRACEEDEVNLP
jgi:hypothetical protein